MLLPGHHPRRRISADHAEFHRLGGRRPDRRAGGLHQIVDHGSGRGSAGPIAGRISNDRRHTAIRAPARCRRRELSRRRPHHPVVADHDRSQAHRHPLRAVDHGVLLHRRRRHRPGAAGTDQPDRPVPDLRRIQSPVHHPRHHHGLVLPGAVDSGDHGQFHFADDDRRAGRGVPAAQSDVVVSLCRRRRFHRLCPVVGRRRHRLDVLSAVLVGIFALERAFPPRPASSLSASPRSPPA